MHTDQHGLKHYELTEKIIKVFFEVYNELGYGFLESVYEESISVALADAGLRVARQAPIAVWFRSHQVGDFPADCLVENLVILELKSARALDPSR